MDESLPDNVLRDLFAGFAIIGIGASQGANGSSPDRIALMAYELADAMLAVRRRPA